MSTAESIEQNAQVIAVFPDKVKISVKDLEIFKNVDETLKVGSYLKIEDSENASLIAIIEKSSGLLAKLKLTTGLSYLKGINWLPDVSKKPHLFSNLIAHNPFLQGVHTS